MNVLFGLSISHTEQSLASAVADFRKLVPMFAGESGEDKLLSDSNENMDAHVNTKISEYEPSAAIRSWVVDVGKSARNQKAAPLGIIRLQPPVIARTDKRSNHRVAKPRSSRPRAPIVIPRVLV